ncbi:MAG: PIN/TRAM domain-containing protein [Caldibacillus debilis]|jgi:uncharacterized protein YacL|uniref:Integral membrane protein (PIN domain superfamily) n=2 Tax=Caldibacillus debilis TaxID=301148 RepID=A0A420VIA7_9BACI|nr:PIN/TRAM domain-containing protein [Caldibacillus debilis]MBO2483134.1 PIN/TRAM domain-containing protein [Bacillaceae bacterium]KYD13657.1 hypothetical protein B4135_2896 [Caldibacillus debilis]MBY6270683.1 PIN/TRAM domain-containing protein [Bacillaceae bacterium]REJ19257.1 MAG: PIN/TRAM domain-containing protein [Caldibacillus debilis]REJ30105.1 MAG: PIN/TRAM domain-containing protein [Caldibacillus debilis]
MLVRIVQIGFLLFGATVGIFFFPYVLDFAGFGDLIVINNPYTLGLFGAILFYFLTFWAVPYVVDFIKWIEESLLKAPPLDLLFGTIGLIIGLIVAYLIGFALNAIQIPVLTEIAPILLTLFFGYLGFQVGFKKREELVNSIVSRSVRKKQAEEEGLKKGNHLKILDTSVIIDGRIADICQTGFIEGTIVIPQFVLEELQHIADSSDALKRNRGRRGLDVLNRIQKDLPIKVEIYEGNFDDVQEVDSKLIKLAKKTNGTVVTNDYNLNKVCELQNVKVLNINDLANAVKPVVLPGEELVVHVIKDGKEENQGVAYLDDGTMIVVEEGRSFIGKTVNVLVTSVLQTSAGRMIFAKPKILEKAL